MGRPYKEELIKENLKLKMEMRDLKVEQRKLKKMLEGEKRTGLNLTFVEPPPRKAVRRRKELDLCLELGFSFLALMFSLWALFRTFCK